MKKININVERCMGCHNCEYACAVAHSSTKNDVETMKLGEKPGNRITVQAYKTYAVPLNCSHCDDAACQNVCPTGAIYRREERGPVLFDKERCIGCSMCVQACPFGVISLNTMGKGVLKCDLCIERLDEGLEPACVEACPTKTLVFGPDEDMNREKRFKSAARIISIEADK